MKETLDAQFLRKVEEGYREDLERLLLLIEEISRLLEVAENISLTPREDDQQ